MTTIRVQEGVPCREECTVAIDGVTNETEGYSAAMRIAANGELVLALAEGSGLTTAPGEDEVVVTIELTAEQTGDLELNVYDFALDLLLDDSVVLRPLRGKLTVEQDVVEG